ncbi:MAG TPA: SDR family oxidoreductase [Candidatus Tumulicola sp.]|jgi:3-oxoacyl-[acyl-carrier protein] reductase
MTNENRTAIVTGAAKGIGAAIAGRLASDGFQTVINYLSSKSEAEQLVAEIASAGGRAIAVQGDVADPAAIRTLFDRAEAEFGGVDVLVNNAGILQRKLMVDVTEDDYQRLIASNLTGSFNGMREGAKRVRDGGRIINFSTSIIGYYVPSYSVYAAAKAAVEAMTHVLAKELGSRNVTVNAIAPGPVATDLFLSGASEEVVQRLTADIPLGRLGQPDDIARVVSFMAGPDSAWVNGQVIKANGGRN